MCQDLWFLMIFIRNIRISRTVSEDGFTVSQDFTESQDIGYSFSGFSQFVRILRVLMIFIGNIRTFIRCLRIFIRDLRIGLRTGGGLKGINIA